MLEGDVVIIDAGRRPLDKEMSKSQFNHRLMRKFWARAGLSIAPEDLDRYRSAWQNASTMAKACAAFASLWDSEVAEAESGGSSRAGQPAPWHLAACPHVAAAFHELSDEVLEWLTHNFLWDKLSRYGLLSDAVSYTHLTLPTKRIV